MAAKPAARTMAALTALSTSLFFKSASGSSPPSGVFEKGESSAPGETPTSADGSLTPFSSVISLSPSETPGVCPLRFRWFLEIFPEICRNLVQRKERFPGRRGGRNCWHTTLPRTAAAAAIFLSPGKSKKREHKFSSLSVRVGGDLGFHWFGRSRGAGLNGRIGMNLDSRFGVGRALVQTSIAPFAVRGARFR